MVEKISFTNEQGIELAALLDLPVDGRPKAFALFAHCFTCSKNIHSARLVSRALTMEGFGVLRFDFSGLGNSKGEFADTNFTTNISDLISAAKFLEDHYEAPQLLVGHSLGGAAVMYGSKQLDSVKAVATIGAPFDPAHVQHLFDDNLDLIEKEGKAKVNIGGRPFFIKKQFLDDIRSHDDKHFVQQLDKALLFMHSPQDTIVDVSNAAEWYQRALHPKSFVSLDGANHLLTDDNDAIYVGQTIAAWSARYVKFKESENLETDAHVVAKTTQFPFLTEMAADGHQFLADEPKSKEGGLGAGPNPYDLLSSALAACTAMTIKYYARLKKWPLEEATVHITHKKTYADDQKKEGQILQFSKRVNIEGKELTQAQHDKLYEVSKKCPVHKSLLGQIEIESEEI